MKKIISILLLSLLALSLVVVAFFGIRQMLANREIAAELENLPDIAPQLQATSHLEIIPLYENAASSDEYVIGHGVSYLIRTDSATVLMDVGHNPDNAPIPPFEQNMQKLGIGWDEIDRIVISHPHPDHVGGVDAWREHTVSMGTFELPDDLGDRLIFVPAPVTFKNAIHATVPTLPAPDVATTGVIPYPEVFPVSLFEPKGMEQALVVNVENEGLVLISGCGHPTLERLVERAESLYGRPVIGVVGGLHYGEATPEEIQPHIQFLRARQPKLLALSPHDSSLQVLEAFESAFPGAYQTINVGNSIQFP
jgi:7,8-dihydropterin-6-yl-methyl-4-(beta-D-ribofuranosyl)aminobenzene 5'-phosphate synthase